MQLRTLTDDELLRHAHTTHDALTSTELESELLRRFEKSIQALEIDSPLLTALDKYSIEFPEHLAEVVEKAAALDERVNGIALLREFDIDEPDTLRALLERIAKFDQVMEDLKAPLISLQQLTTQE